jgi:hypothetical protein
MTTNFSRNEIFVGRALSLPLATLEIAQRFNAGKMGSAKDRVATGTKERMLRLPDLSSLSGLLWTKCNDDPALKRWAIASLINL